VSCDGSGSHVQSQARRLGQVADAVGCGAAESCKRAAVWRDVKFDVSKTAKASKAAGVLARLHRIVETSRCRVEGWNVRARADAGSSWVVAVSSRDAV
jgi:hypothetical protein